MVSLKLNSKQRVPIAFRTLELNIRSSFGLTLRSAAMIVSVDRDLFDDSSAIYKSPWSTLVAIRGMLPC